MRVLGRELSSAALRGGLAIALAVIAGLAIGFVLVPARPDPQKKKPAPPSFVLLDKPLPLDDRTTSRAMVRLRRHVRGQFVLRVGDEERKGVRFGELGVQIDKLRLTQLVRDARDPASPMRSALAGRTEPKPVELPVPLTLDRERTLPLLLKMKDALDSLPEDARLDLEKRELMKERWGRLLDVDATLRAIEASLVRGEREATVVFERVKPRRLASELGNVKFDETLGFFETPYDRSSRYRDRTFNLRLAASKLDGHVLMPGEEFDFNDVVGPRDEAAGYKVATVIAEGELVDGIGGGTCQISGTLHGAAFFAGLEVVERYPHTRPSSYIKMGMDATVVYPTINFRLRNPHDFPVVLHMNVKEGRVRAEVLGPERKNTVTLIRRVYAHVPYEEVERQDPNLPDGTRVLAQRGVPGFKLKRYRIVREGPHAVRKRWLDTYPPTTQLVRVGTGAMPADSVKARDANAPEYIADELLIMTQGPELGDEVQETREPGKYGRYGWTEKEGMPVWKRDD